MLSVWVFTNFLTQFHLFIYTFASNCTRNIKALLSVQPTLCLDNEWKHSTLWCKHATFTYSSLAYWGCDFSYVFVFLCYLFFYKFLRMVVRHLFFFDVSVKDWIILNNSRCFFTPHTQKAEDLELLLMLHPQRLAKMCEVYSHFEIHSPLKPVYGMSITVLCVCIRYG